MGRTKEKDWIRVLFNLDPDINERITELSNFEGVTRSNFIELLVSRWDEGINPLSKLNALHKEREVINAKLAALDVSINKLTTEITAWDVSKREKSKKKPEAIRIITGLLRTNNINEAEKVSRFWQTQTGISAFELLIESRELLNKEKSNQKTLY